MEDELVISENADSWLKLGLVAVSGIAATFVWSRAVNFGDLVQTMITQKGMHIDQATFDRMVQSMSASPALLGSFSMLWTMLISFLLDSAILILATRITKHAVMSYARARDIVATAMVVYIIKFLAIIGWALFRPVGGTPMSQLLPFSLGHLTGKPMLYSIDLFFVTYIVAVLWLLRNGARSTLWVWLASVAGYNTAIIALMS